MKIEQINNLSNETYHNSDKYKNFWSSSNIKNYLETPREAYYQKFVAEKKQSEAFEFGNQIHDYLASKHINGQPFEYNEFEPPINPKTGKPYGKDTKAYQMELAQIVNPISSDTMELIESIWRMIQKSSYSWYINQKVLKNGIAEASFFAEAGMHKYKYRPDILTDGFIFDWKTVTKNSWNERGLKYRITDLGYNISAAMYQYLEHQRTGIWKPFIIIWLMKDPPFDILVQDISTFAYENIGGGEVIANNGAMVFKQLKEQHELCEVSEQWPGLANKYNSFNGVRMADIVPSTFHDVDYQEFEIEKNKF